MNDRYRMKMKAKFRSISVTDLMNEVMARVTPRIDKAKKKARSTSMADLIDKARVKSALVDDLIEKTKIVTFDTVPIAFAPTQPGVGVVDYEESMNER